MPMYEYVCCECTKEFTERHSISERMAPTEDLCPYCKSDGTVSMKIGTPMVSYSTNPGMKTSDNFNARLQEIKKNKGVDNTIETRTGGV